MKKLLSVGFVFLALASAQAQIFRPASVNGALIGGLAGAVIGNNSGSLRHNAWHGAAIGATAGLLMGAAIDDSRSHHRWHQPRVVSPRVYVYRHGWHGYGHRHPGYVSYPRYYHRPDYRGSGVFFGGVSGAIIGHNSGIFRHNAWRGAAWGAGLGYVFGSIAEQNARYREAIEQPPVYIQSAPAAPAPASAAAPAPQNVTIINNYYNGAPTSMAAANGLFGR